VKRITLWDAFSYMEARRSLVHPNEGFKFQLACYELELGYGSSVKHKSEFSSYEFSMMKSKEMIFQRRVRGLFNTVLNLHRKNVSPAAMGV